MLQSTKSSFIEYWLVYDTPKFPCSTSLSVSIVSLVSLWSGPLTFGVGEKRSVRSFKSVEQGGFTARRRVESVDVGPSVHVPTPFRLSLSVVVMSLLLTYDWDGELQVLYYLSLPLTPFVWRTREIFPSVMSQGKLITIHPCTWVTRLRKSERFSSELSIVLKTTWRVETL